MLAPSSVNAAAFATALAADVESWPDDEDWEEEGLDKQKVVADIRTLPTEASLVKREHTVSLHFRDGSASRTVDIAPGITANLLADDKLASFEFSLAYPAAMRRLAAVSDEFSLSVSGPTTRAPDVSQVDAGSTATAQPSASVVPEGNDDSEPIVVTQPTPALLDAHDIQKRMGREVCTEALVADLARDVESMDDDDDWTVEDLDKQAIVAELRGLPAVATCISDEETTVLRFRTPSQQEDVQTIDMARGVRADLLRDGTIASLEFSLVCPSAARRLDTSLKDASLKPQDG
eukprot:gnl/TRDRNA2_/TRDRNA2_92980_c0_seq1.p1 gnl/TRDRNA2_/TRDRNA2_92980_c0~~gnl/TRDRNA2_/TRDRNA2_92980_c0_seq1.p1  ORF type:complete len:291 (+),score=47.39 gnl/TRDRNA2_/TRDRNA2_92980_c0_seq1:131-1003(+)